MDLTLDNEQTQMKNTFRELLEAEGGIELARRQMNNDEDVVDELWSDLAEIGLTALTVPFEQDGFGEGLDYLCLMLEEAGRYAMPGPFPETNAFVVPLLATLGSDDQRETHLPAIADGDERWSFAVYETGSETVPHDVQLRAEPTDNGYRLDGTKTLVPYADTVDNLVVATRGQDGSGVNGISLFIVDRSDVETRRLDSLDETRPLFEVTFDELDVTEDTLLGTSDEGGVPLEDAMDRYTVATCAMLIGAAERAVERSVEHGNTREQFGQPIGRFQAVKHRISDMWMDMRAGRSLVYYASWAVTEDAPDATLAVSATKSFCIDNCIRIFGDDIQNHGGTGFTWDDDAHIYLKQAKAWESVFGSPREHRERLATAHDI